MTNEYVLSRIYAQGWNAAFKLTDEQRAWGDAAATLNPYPAMPERDRWAQGFSGALGAVKQS
jgi:hypothetical protein